ncbi:MAG: hypothetical protein OXH09_20635 [Gammaproteobacteria bacterium]|nr:hypothetical protein [Gammaproteobacteria bacterium]
MNVKPVVRFPTAEQTSNSSTEARPAGGVPRREARIEVVDDNAPNRRWQPGTRFGATVRFAVDRLDMGRQLELDGIAIQR